MTAAPRSLAAVVDALLVERRLAADAICYRLAVLRAPPTPAALERWRDLDVTYHSVLDLWWSIDLPQRLLPAHSEVRS